MDSLVGVQVINVGVRKKAKNIKLVLTDSDGVLTDTGVYYSDKGEELKRFSIRDGMGVERLRTLLGIETGIVTGEHSGSVRKRAEKLDICELHMGVKNKMKVLEDIITRRKIGLENIAYIGDDTNDLEIMKRVGLSVCPSNAVLQVIQIANLVCENKGGHGAFRELAEIIISSQTENGYSN